MAPILARTPPLLFIFALCSFFQESNFQPICRFIPPIFYARALKIGKANESERGAHPFHFMQARWTLCLLLGSCVIFLGKFMSAVSRFAALRWLVCESVMFYGKLYLETTQTKYRSELFMRKWCTFTVPVFSWIFHGRVHWSRSLSTQKMVTYYDINMRLLYLLWIKT